MKFNEKLSCLRKEKHYSQEELAEKLSVSRQAVSKWESGTRYGKAERNRGRERDEEEKTCIMQSWERAAFVPTSLCFS